MAVDSFHPVTGAPQFLDTGAPDIGVDPTEVGKYAADVGNRIIRADLAALTAYSYKRQGLRGHALDTASDYTYSGTGWVLNGGVGGGFFASASGFTYVSVAGGVTVTFPTGRFSVQPAVVATVNNAGAVLVPLITNLTATSFFLRVYTLAGVATTATVAWVATQKTATTVGE